MLLVATNDNEGTLVGCEILVDGVLLSSERQTSEGSDLVCVVDLE